MAPMFQLTLTRKKNLIESNLLQIVFYWTLQGALLVITLSVTEIIISSA